MKKKFTLCILLGIIAAISLEAQQNNLLSHIPPDAVTVFEINLPVMTSKVSWKELIRNFPNKKNDSSRAQMMKLLGDPSLAGIDMQQDMLGASSGNASFDTATFFTVIGHLDNAEKFASAIAQYKPKLKILSMPDKIHVATEKQTSYAWNDQFFVVVDATMSKKGTLYFDSVMVSMGDAQHRTPQQAGRMKLAALESKYAGLSSKRSLAALKGFGKSWFVNDPEFRGAFTDNADIHLWTAQPNSLGLLKRVIPGQMLSRLHSPSDSAMGPRNKLLASIRFENGRISIDGKNMIDPAFSGLYQKLNARTMNSALMSKIPGDNLFGYIAISFDPSFITDMLGDGEARKKIDSALDKKNLKLSELISLFKGDFLLLASMPDYSDSAGRGKVQIAFGATVTSQESFNSVVKKLNSSTDGSDLRGQKSLLDKFKTAFNSQDNILVFSGSQKTADAVVNNHTGPAGDLLTDKMKSNSLNLVIDFRAVQEYVGNPSGEMSPKVKPFVGMLGALDKLIITRGSFRDNISVSHLELKMTDESENSLRTLVKLLSGGK
jgi:hypothetical protein